MKKKSQAASRKKNKHVKKNLQSILNSSDNEKKFNINNHSEEIINPNKEDSAGHYELVAYDESLLEKARIQWQFGDWQRLVKLERNLLENHPDRAKLALLIAAGHIQLNNNQQARQYLRLASEWGCDKKLISQLLVSGVYNSLGKLSAINGQGQRALQHFESAIVIGAPTSEINLLTQARASKQLELIDLQLGSSPSKSISPIFQSVSALIENKLDVKKSKDIQQKQSSNSDNKPKFGSDADIDDFIEDLVPFLSSRSITYVDIGSFIGEVFLKLFQSKKIKIREAHLYEPNPESYRKLKENISGCSLSSLHAYNFAISKKSKDILFSAAKSMSKRLAVSMDADSASNIFKADCFPLDDLATTFTDHHIDLLKIDVEGEEMEVLSTASNLLKEQKIDIIYIEVGFNNKGTQQTYLVDIDIFLQSYGYRVFKIYEQTNEWIQDSPLLRRCNVAYMSSRFAQANPYKLTIENHKLREELSRIKSVS